MSVAPLFLAAQTVNTQLTPNCNAHADAAFDLNDTTRVTFYYQDRTPIWLALLSVASQQVTLIQSVSACGITLEEELRVTFNPMGGTYTVLLGGKIIDADTTHKFEGLSLGVFSRSSEMKCAVRSIRKGSYRF